MRIYSNISFCQVELNIKSVYPDEGCPTLEQTKIIRKLNLSKLKK